MKKSLLKSVLTLFAIFCIQFANAQEPLEYVYTNHLGGLEEEQIIDLETDSQNNIYVITNTGSNEIFYNDSIVGSDSSEFFIMKYNPSGDLVYSYGLRTKENEYPVHAFKMELDGNDDLFFTAGLKGTFQFGDTTIYSEDWQVFICKLNSNGEPDQIKLFNVSNQNIGITYFKIDEIGNLYFSGRSHDTMYFDQNNDTIFAPLGTWKMPVWKYDANFNLQWIKVFYSNYSIPGAGHLDLDTENNLVLASRFQGNTLYYEDQSFQYTMDEHILFTKISSTGDIIWVKTADGNFNPHKYDICSDEQNNIYFTSTYYDTIFYDSTLILPIYNNLSKAFVLSIDSEGDFRWYNRMSDITTWPTWIPPSEIKVKDNYVYVGGDYRTNSYFGEVYLPRVTDDADSFLSKMDAETGDFLWAQGFYGDNLAWYNSFHFDFGEGNDIYIAGVFTGEGLFGEEVIQSYGEEDLFIIKLNETFVGFEEIENELTTLVFPNPGSDKLIIQSPVKGVKVQLYNQTGQVVLEKYLQDAMTHSINTSSLPVGLYIYKFTSKDGFIENGKWIKQQ
ncbi:MAG: T9SS type A sorting domain-containing protein [Bacteroidales bacterium]|nr:T9SS type A sorting domain-containing protein [Bacteroidales bacterium]